MCMMIKLAIAIELPWGGDTFSRAGEDLDEDDAVLGHLLDPVVDGRSPSSRSFPAVRPRPLASRAMHT